jgi:dienelactone hydrolase
VLVGACRQPSPTAHPADDPPSEGRDVSLAGGFVTVHLEIPPLPAGPKPVILAPVGDAKSLLEAGAITAMFQVHWDQLAPLAPKTSTEPPKNTVGEWLLASPTAGSVGHAYFSLLTVDANQTIPSVIDYLVTMPEVDADRIAIAGASTTGFRALQAIARDRRIKVGVVFSAAGDYHCFLHLSRLAMKGEPLALDPDYEAWLRTEEPIRHPERLTHAALLMVNGTEDLAVPYPCAQRTEQVFRRAYRRAHAEDRYRPVTLDGAGHTLDDRAQQEAMAWLNRWLFTSGTGRP